MSLRNVTTHALRADWSKTGRHCVLRILETRKTLHATRRRVVCLTHKVRFTTLTPFKHTTRDIGI